MKPARLSLRLGLSVILMGAALVLLLAALAVFALDRELDQRARDHLERKMEQIEHSLNIDLKVSDLSARAHPLLDVVMGLRVNEEEESVGLDLAQHNERGYNL